MVQRVLLVEDDKSLRTLMARELLKADFKVEMADGGQPALQKLAHQRYDVVVCDLKMPVVDGIEVLQFTQSLPSPPPFLMVSAFGSIPAAIEALKKGADDFLEKPYNPGQLARKVSELIDEHLQLETADAQASEAPLFSARRLRDLEALLERLYMSCFHTERTVREVEEQLDFISPQLSAATSTGLQRALADYEEMLIRRAMERANGNRSEAARLLKLSRTTLVTKIKRLGLDEDFG